jgi:hypothetical protein
MPRLVVMRWPFCLVVLAVVLFCAYRASEQARARRLDSRLNENWDRVELHFSRTQYEELFGPPTATWIERGIDFVRWDGCERFLELECRRSGVVYSFGKQPELKQHLERWWVKRFHCKWPLT